MNAVTRLLRDLVAIPSVNPRLLGPEVESPAEEPVAEHLSGMAQKHGLDVEIKQGGPQINGLQLLLTGKIDFYLGDPIQTIQSVHQGAPLVTVAAAFQKTPQVIICHQDVSSLADAKGHPMLIDQSSAAQTFWPWLKAEYGFEDDVVHAYTFSVAPFLTDETGAWTLSTANP